MTDEADRSTNTQDPGYRESVKRAVLALLDGRGLDVEERRHELLLTNPDHSEWGQMCVEFDGCHVSLRHVTWEYFSQLAGFEAAGDTGVTAQQIVNALNVPG
jgi:hypothetical protein